MTSRDEILYHAKLHPEQYSDTFSSKQLKQLHTSILHVCQTAVDLLADASKFPEDWLFSHRWGKGKKNGATALPSGEKIIFLTVGGRTSCVVPSVQKKTGRVAADIKLDAEDEITEDVKAEMKSSGDESTVEKQKKPTRKRKTPAVDDEEIDNVKPKTNANLAKSRKPNGKSTGGKGDIADPSEQDDSPTTAEQRPKKQKTSQKLAKAKVEVVDRKTSGSRRSARLSTG